LINTLRRLNQLKPFLVQDFIQIFNSVPLEEYQEGRNLLELLDMLIRAGNNQFTDKTPYLESIFSMTLREFDLGTQKVIIDTFKLKWM
jgi:hypothetical protein